MSGDSLEHGEKMTDELWRGLPEFHQPRYEPFKKIAITVTRENNRTVFCRFATEEDYRTFCAKLQPSQDPENLTMITCWLLGEFCLLYTSPSPRDGLLSRMPSSA